jgi:tetratricopeptide (TPR) repeat protein
MRQCRERKLHRQVVKVGEYLEQLNSGNVPYADYKFYYAEGLVGLGRFDDAILCYRQIFKKYPKAHDKAEALMEIGNVFRYHIYNFDSALVYYDSVVNHYLIEPINTASLYERAKLFLVYSELDKAKNAFLSLKEKCRSTEMKELMDYYLAMIHLYNNEFEEADMSFRMLIKTYPRGYYVNDALISSLIIGETLPSSPEALAGYAEALFYETRLMPDSVVSKYKTVINMGATPIVGLAMYKLALYYSNLGDTTASLEMIEKMDSLYSEDYFFPYVLKLKADIYSDNVEKRETAVEIYKDILQNYSTYPFIGETREALQRIQDSEPIG